MTLTEEGTSICLCECPDKPGITLALTDLIFRNGGNIVSADQFTDQLRGRFYLRIEWERSGFRLNDEMLIAALNGLAAEFSLSYRLAHSTEVPNIALFCSKTAHCVYDVLLRWQLQELPCNIVAMISNHESMQEVANHFDVPFHWIPVEKGKKAEAELAQQKILEESKVDTLVLARYMQVLSPSFVNQYQNNIINIHHSFLPAFVGAKPYHQAYERGVKVIGATAHYVTEDLDEGPIIQQDVVHISHRDSVEDMVRKGRDCERQVLSSALKLHVEHRVIVDAHRTIVFA